MGGCTLPVGEGNIPGGAGGGACSQGALPQVVASRAACWELLRVMGAFWGACAQPGGCRGREGSSVWIRLGACGGREHSGGVVHFDATPKPSQLTQSTPILNAPRVPSAPASSASTRCCKMKGSPFEMMTPSAGSASCAPQGCSAWPLRGQLAVTSPGMTKPSQMLTSSPIIMQLSGRAAGKAAGGGHRRESAQLLVQHASCVPTFLLAFIAGALLPFVQWPGPLVHLALDTLG